MKKEKLILPSIALLCASLAWAQAPATQQPSAQSSTTSADTTAPSPGSLQGCLSGSSGNYTLTQENTGATMKLVGADDKLKTHVGHEVAVMGQISAAAEAAGTAQDQNQGSTSTSSSANAAGENTFQVSDVTMISDHCGPGSAGSTAPPSASNTSGSSGDMNSAAQAGGANPAPSPTNPAADSMGGQSGASSPSTAQRDSGSTGAMNSGPTSSETPQNSQAQNEEQSPDSQSPSAAQSAPGKATDTPTEKKGGESLPQTASALPFLAVLGVGFLTAGLISGSRRKSKREPSLFESFSTHRR